jgi:hypothetical protein
MIDHSVRPPVKDRPHFQVVFHLAKGFLDLQQSFVMGQRLLAVAFGRALVGMQQEPAINLLLLLDELCLACPF